MCLTNRLFLCFIFSLSSFIIALFHYFFFLIVCSFFFLFCFVYFSCRHFKQTTTKYILHIFIARENNTKSRSRVCVCCVLLLLLLCVIAHACFVYLVVFFVCLFVCSAPLNSTLSKSMSQDVVAKNAQCPQGSQAHRREQSTLN